jgi:uncharacterized protein
MLVARKILPHLQKMLRQFPVVSLTGPRQSGKTTLLTTAFPHFRYYNLERPDHRMLVAEDPVGFLQDQGPGVIFDEAQNLPELFSYIQVVSDQRNTPGQYILSGSQSFLMNEKISQSLAGRVYVSHLLPYQIGELKKQEDLFQTIFEGFYPRLHQTGIHAADFFPSYIQTYIERDIRTLRSIEDFGAFTRFMGLCAGRTGQVLNVSSLANDAGVAMNTAKAWLSLLETSFIVFLLQPWHRNLNKRIIKSPKLYFYDTGLVCSLLRISSQESISTHYLYGALFENLVIADLMKQFHHKGLRPPLYYWRESNGIEIDCIVERPNNQVLAIEIKAGQTYNKDYLKNLKNFPLREAEKRLIYSGEQGFEVSGISIQGWKEALMDAFV